MTKFLDSAGVSRLLANVAEVISDKSPKRFYVDITKKSGKFAASVTATEFLTAFNEGREIIVTYAGEGCARLADQWDDMYEFVQVETEDPDNTDPTKVDGLGMVCTICDLFVDSTTDTITVRYRWPRPLTQQKSIVQTTGTSTTTIMSQNAVTTELANKADKAKFDSLATAVGNLEAGLVRYRIVPLFNPVPADMQGTVCSELFTIYTQDASGIMTEMSDDDLVSSGMYFSLTNTDYDGDYYFFAGDYQTTPLSCPTNQATISLYDGNNNLLDILVMAMNIE